MALSAGRLRHRVRIEKPTHTQDPITGEMVLSWDLVAEKVPAAIEPLSAREFIAAQAVQSQVTTRIVIRRREIDASMRIVHGGKVYNIHGVLPDAVSGLEYVTLPCSAGVNDG